MRLNDGRAIPTFIGQVLRDESISVFGDGLQTRSFCYVDDLVEGIYKLLHSDFSMPINLGNPDEISIIELAKAIATMGQSAQQILYKPLPKDDPLKRRPDISLAKKILNWHPIVQRNEGLHRTLEYFKKLPKEKLFEVNHKDFSKHIKF